MDTLFKKNLLAHFFNYISDNKKNKFLHIIQYRTKYLTVVLEDIFQPHNASAVIRTCDCFGIQEVHIIENQNKYTLNPDITLGSNKWVSMLHYNSSSENTESTLNQLKNNGYKIAVTTPHRQSMKPSDIPVDHKTAIVFGSELNGVSDIAMKAADFFVKIPMYGFTESLNISVSAAIIIQILTEKLRKSEVSWQLNEEEKTEVLLRWARSTVRLHGAIEKDFLEKYNGQTL